MKEIILNQRLERANKRISTLEKMIEDRTREVYLEQEQLRQAHTYVNKILETMQSSVIVVDEHNFISSANSTTFSWLNYIPEDIIGEPISMLAPEISLSNNYIDENIKLETFYKKADGTKIPVIFSTAPLDRIDMGCRGYVCVAHDISEKKSLEAQILQTQKLEAIGQLASGIAHEINTPIQFVGDNTRFLQDSFDDLMDLLDLLKLGLATEKIESVTDPRVMKEKFENVDFDFLRDEIPKAIQQTLEGVNRVTNIVKAMKEFAHPGGERKQLVELNKLIESTTIVSTNEWKYVSEMEFNRNNDLPLVPCLPGELNQVLLNIIINAAHAIADQNKKINRGKGKIKIWTEFSKGKEVVINIQDNGGGIPKDISNKVYDPFFTTKEVGRGTGQGLAMARSIIVDKHKGKLDFISEDDVGTTFRITLPNED